ncbi:MAG TPA: ribonuclease T2 [Devosiaceae bacterium]
MSGDFVLAASWQPAFCEMQPGKPECRTQTPSRYDADHFALHGLWPEPASATYCGVGNALIAADRRGDWGSLPRPDLSPQTRKALERVMPGTLSLLERHEWIKHGTCAGVPAETYFSMSIALVEALNASGVRELFRGRIGTDVTSAQIRNAFEAAFGDGAGRRVLVDCARDGGRTLIGELRIALTGTLSGNPSLADLVRTAPEQARGCPVGQVDAVGQR